MADPVRILCIILLAFQILALLAITFAHSRERREHEHFTRWWLHAYGLSVAYCGLAVRTGYAIYRHLGEPPNFLTSLTATAVFVGTVSIGAVWWLWLLERREGYEGRQ